MSDDETTPRRDDDAETDESPIERSRRSLDEAKHAAEQDRRLAEAQAGFESMPLEDPPQQRTGHTPP
ncbi:hypothetical protein [Saccharomonospora saliphila]|uniref:hypothetical protein n=1 Tax=Saccharomonospora saliphila TaxID=369829 RepID=UPI0003706E23|nr:hypothetical protein [Saccharomonospora saliphila]